MKTRLQRLALRLGWPLLEKIIPSHMDAIAGLAEIDGTLAARTKEEKTRARIEADAVRQTTTILLARLRTSLGLPQR